MQKKLNLDQLIHIVQNYTDPPEYTEKQKKVYKVLTDVQKFIKAFSIKDGKYQVYWKPIFKAYSIWSLEPLGQQEFLKEFGLHFQSIHKEQKQHFLISVPPKRMLFKAAEFKSLYVEEEGKS